MSFLYTLYLLFIANISFVSWFSEVYDRYTCQLINVNVNN